MGNILDNYDFSGWATKANLKCSDGRIITPDAFKHMDGVEVPLVWNHVHNDINNVLGKALLVHREGQGVYAYGKFNDSDSGKAAKAVLENGDVTHLSIWANNLKQHMNSVLHGNIREVSLVLAGANPGAVIDNVAIMHGDVMHEYDDEARIYTDEPFVLHHADADDNKEKDDESDKEQKGEDEVSQQVKEDAKSKVETVEVKEAEVETKEEAKAETSEETKEEVKEEKKEEELEHSDKDDEGSDKTVGDVLKTFNKEQETVLNYLVGQALADGKATKNDNKDSEGGNNEMKHNVFDQTDVQENNTDVLSHSEMVAIIKEAKDTKSSLKDVCLAHGITDLDIMFPDHKALSNEPEFIKRNDDWVGKVLGGVHHSPFSRIKTIFADITAAEARAKGYQKGNLKIEEVFKLLKRITNPTTLYKKQKLDRDDILDIVDFDILPWLKKELRMMLNEESARAILIGDGRDPVDEANDKIDEECIRPIWKMEELFTVKVPVKVSASATGAERAKAFITETVKSRKLYKGSGNPDMFISEDLLTECLLLEDVNGRVIYDTEEKLRARLRVREIIPVPVMEGDAIKRTDESGKTFELGAIYVNLKDYNVGTDKGGEVNFFDDFDIDYNQMKYLMETRFSGTLVKPFSAVAIEFTDSAQG